MKSIPRDTDLKSARRRYSVLRDNSPADRLDMAFELSDILRETLAAGIKQRHPDYSKGMVHRETLRLTLGKELFKKFESHSSTEQR
ncbi:MAG: hypothetical protein V1789_09690 [PVC group bacterium]